MTREQFIEKWKLVFPVDQEEFETDLNSLFNLRSEEEKPKVIKTKGGNKYLGIKWEFEGSNYILDKEYFEDNTVKLTWYYEDLSNVTDETLIYKLNASYQFRR